MKIQGARKVHYDSGPNLAPLVDIVMVILIFLMLAGTFGGAEHYLVSNLPFSGKAAGHEKPAPGRLADEPLEIRVDSPLPGTWIARAGKIRTSDLATLTGQLAKMRRDYNAAGTPTDRIQIVISPGRNVRYEYLIGVYQSALDADFTKVAFATGH
jgi:biopolymer transport protein ExbD